MAESLKVLLVEDHLPDAELVRALLNEDRGRCEFKVTQLTRLEGVPEAMRRGRFDVVLLDLTLPDATGLETLRRMVSFEPDVPVVVLTGHEDETLGIQAIQNGAQDYLPKRNLEGDLLRRAIRYSIQRKNSEQLIQKLAHFDTLTNLPNRQLFLDRFHQMIAHAHRDGSSFGVYFIDLDHFKDINDRLGHDAGDEVLKEVATRLSRVVRNEDTVARFGGDEFTVLVPDVLDEEGASRVAGKILKVFGNPMTLMREAVTVTPSIGVALFPRDGRDVKTLLQRADIAMYSAKRTGAGRFSFFGSSLNHHEAYSSIGSHFKRAIDQNEFEVVLQPRFDLATGLVKGAEALLRWRTPDRGLLFPGEFLDLAEKHGQMELLGRWMLTTVLKHMRQSQLNGESYLVSVNLSPSEILRVGFADELARLCHSFGVPPHMLEIEMTESQVVPNWQQTVAILGSLRRLGIRIAMDDFGSGYASLDYLIRQTFDTLKLDRGMIRNVPENISDSQVVKSVISLCRRIGVSVVAEGVEGRAQLSFLKKVGCHEVQGFLIGKPMSLAAFEEFLHTTSARLRVSPGNVRRPYEQKNEKEIDFKNTRRSQHSTH